MDLWSTVSSEENDYTVVGVVGNFSVGVQSSRGRGSPVPRGDGVAHHEVDGPSGLAVDVAVADGGSSRDRGDETTLGIPSVTMEDKVTGAVGVLRNPDTHDVVASV